MAKKGLGKGLNALISDPHVEDTAPVISKDAVITLKLMDVEPNSNQPRKAFDDEALNELSKSIKEHGVISPIIVSPPVNGYYKIIAGERRWRASKLAGMKTIPAIIKEYDDENLYEVALIENLQRQDLNPVEEAMGYKKLMDDFNLTQEKIAEKLSKSRSSIANSLRLLAL
jgi:ParB family chromosome partitioning protein